MAAVDPTEVEARGEASGLSLTAADHEALRREAAEMTARAMMMRHLNARLRVWNLAELVLDTRLDLLEVLEQQRALLTQLRSGAALLPPPTTGADGEE